MNFTKLALAIVVAWGPPILAQSSLHRLDEFTLARLRASQTARAKQLEPSVLESMPAHKSQGHSMKLRTTEVDRYGRTIARFDHYFHGVRVEGSEAIGIIGPDDTTEKVTYPFATFLDPPSGKINPSVPEQHAIDLASHALNLAQGEPVQSSTELALRPSIERRFYSGPSSNPGGRRNADPVQSVRVLKDWRLVYIVQSYLPWRSQAFTTSVDAVSGLVISHGPNASCTAEIQGVAQFNRWNGSNVLQLPGYESDGAYFLQRGGIFSVNVGDVQNAVYSSSTPWFGDGTEYTSGVPGSVNGQTQAVDIFHGISSAYDFYLTLFGRHGIDGSDGYFIPVAAHHPNNLPKGASANFWWWRNYFLGQENYWIDFTDQFDLSRPGGPTELSVTTHEWTHGVTRRCSRVGTDDRDTAEAKAINEASSTVMSTAARLWDSTGRYGGIGYPDPGRWTYDWVYQPQVYGGYPYRPDPVGVEFLYRPSHPTVRGRNEPSWWTASKAGWTADSHGMGAPIHRLFYFLANGSPALTNPDDLSDEVRGRTSPFMPLGFDGLGTHNATVLFYQAMSQTFTTWMDLIDVGPAVKQAADQIFGAGSANSRIAAQAVAAVNLSSPPTYGFPSGQSHTALGTALIQPTNEHAAVSIEQLPAGSSSLYYGVTLPPHVSLTVSTKAKLKSSASTSEGPSIQFLDESGGTIYAGAGPESYGLMNLTSSKQLIIDLMPGDGDPPPSYQWLGATLTWRNDGSAPIYVIVRVFSESLRTWAYSNTLNTRLDIRHITADDLQAVLW